MIDTTYVNAESCRGWAGFYADHRAAMCEAARAVLGPAGYPYLAEDAAHDAIITLMAKHPRACSIASPHGLAVVAARRRAISMLRGAWYTRTAACNLADLDGVEAGDDLQPPARLGSSSAVQPASTADVCLRAALPAGLQLPDVADEICERAALVQVAELLQVQLAAMPAAQRCVVVEVVLHGQPATNVAHALHLTAARISQIKKAALTTLRSRALHPARALL